MSILDILLNQHLNDDGETSEYKQAEKELRIAFEQLKEVNDGFQMIEKLENCIAALERETGKRMYKKGFSDAIRLCLELMEGK